jgi:outer membrane protein, multidrug efflux system
MRTFSLKNIAITLGCILLAFSCSTSMKIPLQTVNTSGLYRDSAATDTISIANRSWDDLFTDRQLKQLVKEGLTNNLDLKIAIKNVEEAEAYFRQGKANLLPSVSALATVNYSKNPSWLIPGGPTDIKYYTLGLEASWEIDIWGKLRTAKRAAYANMLASDAGRKAIQTRLISDIATAYYNLLALDAKLTITEQTVKTSIELVETMKLLKDNGKVTEAAVVQSEAARYAAEVMIPDLKQLILEQENALSLLLGHSGAPVVRDKLEEQPPVPVMQTGIPSLLLENRPDVLRAEYLVLNAYQTTRSARTYFYPAITITATGGLESLALNQLFDPSAIVASVIGGLTQPLFNKRANITRLRVAQSQQEAMLLSFESTLYTAGNEVQNALGSYQSSVSKIKLREMQLEALIRSVNYTKELLTYGTANYIEVLNARQSLLSAQLENVNDHLQQLTSVVSLYRALGGGWK